MQRLSTIFLMILLITVQSCAPKQEGAETPALKTDSADSAGKNSEHEQQKEVGPSDTFYEKRPLDKKRSWKYTKEAINHLQVGDEEKARAKLRKAISYNPDSNIALDLMQQLDGDPATILGSKSFSYTVRSGESLSVIAKKFFGDPLQFWILARYNSIDNPSRLQAGQVINIPKSKELTQATRETEAPSPAEINVTTETEADAVVKSLVPSDAKDPAAREESPVAESHVLQETAEPSLKKVEEQQIAADFTKVKILYDTENYAGAIGLLEVLAQNPAAKDKAEDMLVSAYSKHAQELKGQNDYLGAQENLDKALVLQPDNAELAWQLSDVKRRLSAQRLYNDGMEALEKGDIEEAYETFLQVLIVQPDHAGASEQNALLEPEMAEAYHKQAMLAYRRQELDKAISLWDKVLDLDPDHELAKLYRANALELKEKIKKF